MTRILHTADWQIGRLYGSFDPDDAVPLVEARFAAVERIAELAQEEQVDAVVVAGDVFDAQTISARSIRRLFNALERYSGPWIMIPGNHDAALAESVWTHALRLKAVPGNVRLVLTPNVVELPQARLALLCAPLTQRHTYSDLTEWFDAASTPSGWRRVGVAHGAVQGILAEDIDSTNPIAADRADRAHLDYLALGDWHGTRQINDRTWYSGSPEQDRFRNNDAGQALLVNLGEQGSPPTVQPVRTGRFRWSQRAHILNVKTDVDAVIASLAEIDANDVIEIQLEGGVDLMDHRRLLRALGEAEARARCLRRNLSGLRLAPTHDDIAALRADGYLGDVIGELREESLVTVDDAARRSQDALAILTQLLDDRSAVTAGEARP